MSSYLCILDINVIWVLRGYYFRSISLSRVYKDIFAFAGKTTNDCEELVNNSNLHATSVLKPEVKTKADIKEVK